MTQTGLSNTIKAVMDKFDNKYSKQLANFDDKHAKQDEEFKEYVKTIIANQDTKVDKKFKNI